MKQIWKIDREFANLSVPLTNEEQAILENSILREGCLEPIVVWNGIIIDGHKRYAFCCFEEIEFSVQEMEFSCREEAIRWITRRRIPQARKGSMIQKYLLGKRYQCEKSLGREQHSKKQAQKGKDGGNASESYLPLPVTIMDLAEEYNIHRNEPKHYGDLSKVLDMIDELEPAVFQAFIQEEIKMSINRIIELGDADPRDIHATVRKLLARIQSAAMKPHSRMNQQQKEKRRNLIAERPLSVGIKEMPTYDPDAEVRGLALTVTTWIMMLERKMGKLNLGSASTEVKEQLSKNLRAMDAELEKAIRVVE